MFGSSGDDDFGLSEFTQKKNPIDSFSYKQKMREMIERDDLEDLGTHIQESMDGKGHFDWKRMNSLSGTADFKNMDFSSLKSTGRDGTDLRDITVLG
jgi:hypothetical protein